MAGPDDYLYKSRIHYRQNRADFAFDIAEGLFSSVGIDAGTRFLLRWLGGSAYETFERVLDLGCGYGPIAITLAKFRDNRVVTCVDRDALAVEYTAWNAGLNAVEERITVRPGIGYQDLPVGSTFDLVVSNIPAKIGHEGLENFLFGAAPLLAPEGRVAVVVIDRLRDLVTQSLASHGVEVVERHDNRGYAVLVFAPPPAAPLDDEFTAMYARDEPRRFRFGKVAWEVRPTHTLPEFDTFRYSTLEAFGLLPAHRDRYTVVGSGHGHLAAYIRTTAPDAHLTVVDRDLLALRATSDTLARIDSAGSVSADFAHTARPIGLDRADGDCVVMRADEREPVRVTARAAIAVLDEGGPTSSLVLHGRASDTSRVVDLVRRQRRRATVRAESRNRGHAAVQITHKR